MALYGRQVVVEIPDGAAEGPVTEQGLHITRVVSVLVERHGGGAAEVVRRELARDADGPAQSDECGAERVRIVGARRELVGPVERMAPMDLAHKRFGITEITLVDVGGDLIGDWQSETFAELGGEAELVQDRVIAARSEARGGPAANGEVGAKQYPETHVRWRSGEQVLLLLLRGPDVARAQSRVLADQVSKIGRAVVLGEPA